MNPTFMEFISYDVKLTRFGHQKKNLKNSENIEVEKHKWKLNLV